MRCSPLAKPLIALSALGLTVLAGPAGAQGGNPFEERGAGSAAPADADLPAPGVLPAGTSAAAAELWGKLLAASRAPLQGAGEGAGEGAGDAAGTAAPQRQPLAAFDVAFDATLRSGEGLRVQNEATFRQSFLAPYYVRTVILDGGGERELGRDGTGPNSYWLRDPKDKDSQGRARVVRLAGRDYATDRRQIDDVLAVCEAFRAFTDPSTLRLTRLEAGTPPLCELPGDDAAPGSGLQWLELESPDFHLPGAPSRGPGGQRLTSLLRLGLDPETFLVRQALVVGPPPQTIEGAPVDRAAHFLVLGGERNRYRAFGGYRLPMGVDLWPFTLRETGAGDRVVRTSLGLHEKPTQSFALKRDLIVNPPLTPADFQP